MHVLVGDPGPRVGRILPGSFQPAIVAPDDDSGGGGGTTTFLETGTSLVEGTSGAIAAVGQTTPITVAAGQKVIVWFNLNLQQTSGDSPGEYEYQIWNETAGYAIGPVLKTPPVSTTAHFPLIACAEDDEPDPGTYQYSLRVTGGTTGSASYASQNSVWALVTV